MYQIPTWKKSRFIQQKIIMIYIEIASCCSYNSSKSRKCCGFSKVPLHCRLVNKMIRWKTYLHESIKRPKEGRCIDYMLNRAAMRGKTSKNRGLVWTLQKRTWWRQKTNAGDTSWWGCHFTCSGSWQCQKSTVAALCCTSFHSNTWSLYWLTK